MLEDLQRPVSLTFILYSILVTVALIVVGALLYRERRRQYFNIPEDDTLPIQIPEPRPVVIAPLQPPYVPAQRLAQPAAVILPQPQPAAPTSFIPIFPPAIAAPPVPQRRPIPQPRSRASPPSPVQQRSESSRDVSIRLMEDTMTANTSRVRLSLIRKTIELIIFFSVLYLLLLLLSVLLLCVFLKIIN